MGNFRDNIRKILNPKKHKQVEFNRSVGLKDNARLIKRDQMREPHNAYFIRSASNHNLFLKFLNGEYFVKEGPEMACVWTYQNAQKFIAEAKYADLEMIRMDEVLKK